MNNGYCTWRPIHFLWSYLSEFFLEWEMFRTKVVEQIKTHILRSVIFSPENRAICEIMWKNYCRAWQVTDGNKIQHILVYVACWMSCGKHSTWSHRITVLKCRNFCTKVKWARSFSYLCLLSFRPTCIFNAWCLLDWRSTRIHRIAELIYRNFCTRFKCGRSFSYLCLLSFGPFVVSGCLVFLKHLFLFFLRSWGSLLSLVTTLQV